MIVDSHCHLDYSNLYNQLDDVIKRAEYNQVKYFLTICTTLESFDTIKLITDKYENIYGTFGIHPHESKKYTNLALKKNSRLSAAYNNLGLIYLAYGEKNKAKNQNSVSNKL